jgi:hypothetical protein
VPTSRVTYRHRSCSLIDPAPKDFNSARALSQPARMTPSSVGIAGRPRSTCREDVGSCGRSSASVGATVPQNNMFHIMWNGRILHVDPDHSMFHITRNMGKSGTMAERVAVDAVRKRLPPGWSAELRSAAGGENHLLILRGADGRRTKLKVVSRKRVSPKDVPYLVRQTKDADQLLLVAPFLSVRARELLADANASYVDATGNLRLVASDPAVFLETQGADSDPDRRPRALRSLKGAAAGRVVRALCDFLPPYGVRSLAESSSTPLGTVSRVVSFLEEEALLARDEKKVITAVDWPALITRWARDYGVTSSNAIRSYLEPRGLAALGSKFPMLGRYAVTGTLAGPGIAPARLAMIYVDDVERAAASLELVPTEAGANVWLLEPYDEVVFERTQQLPFAPAPQSFTVVAAAPTQVAVDLMTSPGRGPQEGEALIEKMKGTIDAWRQSPRA